MTDLLSDITAGISGFVGGLFFHLGVSRAKIINLEKQAEKMRSVDTCHEMNNAIKNRLKIIESLQQESRQDIKEILRNLRGNGQ